MGLVEKIGPITLKAIINRMLIKHNYNPKKNSSFQVAPVVKNPPANAGDIRDLGLTPKLGRFPGGGNGNPLQYSCLENPMDGGAG